jgi:hypothetical protein
MPLRSLQLFAQRFQLGLRRVQTLLQLAALCLLVAGLLRQLPLNFGQTLFGFGELRLRVLLLLGQGSLHVLQPGSELRTMRGRLVAFLFQPALTLPECLGFLL